MPTPESDEPQSEVIVESRIVEHDRNHLNEQEHLLLKELLRPGASIEAVIPDDAEPEELWRTLDACVRGLGLLETRVCRVKPIIGRILLIFERKPSLYKELGYETYSDFMKLGVYEKLHLHRTSAYEGKLVAEKWPQIGPDRYAAKLGPKKINILSKFTTGSNSNAEALLQVAESMTVPQFQQYVEQRGLLAPGESKGATITIATNRNIYSHFKSFFNDGRIHQVVGSKDHDRILEAMMQETYDEWVDRYEQNRRAKLAQQEATI